MEKGKGKHVCSEMAVHVFNLLPNGYFACFLSADFFQNQFFFSKNSNTIKVSNRLDPDQARHFVGPDLSPNCLQRLSADDTLVGKELTF